MTRIVGIVRRCLVAVLSGARSIQTRLVLAYALLVVPSAYLLYGLIDNRAGQLAFVRTELTGLGFAADLRDVRLQLALADDERAAPMLLDALGAALRRHEPEFDVLGFGNVGRAAFTQMIEQRIVSVSELEARLDHLLREVSDRANLILDPELRSYHTVELSIVVIPQLIDRVAELVRLDSGHAVFAGFTSVGRAGAERALSVAGQISMLLDQMRIASESVDEQVDSRQVIGADASVRRCVSVLADAATRSDGDRAVCVDALQRLTAVARLADSALGRLLADRVARIERTFWPIIVSAGLSALLSLAFFVIAVRNRIVKPLMAMTVAMSRLAEGDLSVPVARLNRRDELGAMSSALVVFHESMAERERAQILAAEKEAAEAASRFKSSFVANISHELRTPLNAILGYTELILEDEGQVDATEVLDVAKRIHDSAAHLQSLINDILDLSKIEAGRMTLEAQPLAIGELLLAIEPIVAPLAIKNENRLELVALEPSLSMVGDPVRVRQIVLNLLSNACKFTTNGVVRLTIDQAGSRGRPLIRFEVSDTGIGIAPEALERLFTPFAQADGTITRRFGGTGLGLSISFQLCTLMGGSIRVSSVPNEGSVFTAELPLDPTRGGQPARETTALDDRPTGAPDGVASPAASLKLV